MNHHIDDFNSYVDKMYKKQSELVSELSRVDKEQDDILHFLELEKYNAATMMMVVKKLKEVRVNRRIIKDELAEVQAVCSRIKPCNQKNGERTYTYKTGILKEYKKEG